jgi:hypothetical protein
MVMILDIYVSINGIGISDRKPNAVDGMEVIMEISRINAMGLSA